MASIPEENTTRKKQIFHKELSFKVVECAYKVHRTLGPGFPEGVYQKALCYEMITAKIPFESEKAIEVFYDGKICGKFRTDLVVDNKIVLELKALDELNSNHISQAVSYLKATGLKLAILINFGTESLETQRVVL